MLQAKPVTFESLFQAELNWSECTIGLRDIR